MVRLGRAGMARRGQSGCGSVCHGPVGYGQAWFGVAGMATHGNFWPGMDGGARFVLAGQAWLGIARRVVVRHGRQGVARSGAVRCVTVRHGTVGWGFGTVW